MDTTPLDMNVERAHRTVRAWGARGCVCGHHLWPTTTTCSPRQKPLPKTVRWWFSATIRFMVCFVAKKWKKEHKTA